MTASVHDLLRDAIRQRYGGNLTRLAEALDVPVQSVSKWVADDAHKRTVPGPTSCQKIARGLGLDADYVLELAGHRPAAADGADVDLGQSELDARLARLSRPLTPEGGGKVIKRLGDAAGVEETVAHRFRHTFCTQYLTVHAGDEMGLRRIVGHLSHEVLSSYIHLSQIALRQRMDGVSLSTSWLQAKSP